MKLRVRKRGYPPPSPVRRESQCADRVATGIGDPEVETPPEAGLSDLQQDRRPAFRQVHGDDVLVEGCPTLDEAVVEPLAADPQGTTESLLPSLTCACTGSCASTHTRAYATAQDERCVRYGCHGVETPFRQNIGR